MESRFGSSDLWAGVVAMFSRSTRWMATWVLATSISAAFASPIVLDQNGVADLNNLRQIALALHNFESANGVFPPQFISSAGTPLLSWRVALLPFLGLQGLYDQFNTTEAWNSSTNLPLLHQMPDIYRTPMDSPTSTITRYAVPAGPGTMFEGANGVTLGSVTDGTSFTILVGETEGSNIPWTQPIDIPIGPPTTLGASGFSSFITGAVPFAFVDGTVKLLPDNIDSTKLHNLFIRNDGAVIPTDPSVSYVVVPEPGSVVLLMSGLVPFLLIARRFRAPVRNPTLAGC
jgi:hypothetical protein